MLIESNNYVFGLVFCFFFFNFFMLVVVYFYYILQKYKAMNGNLKNSSWPFNLSNTKAQYMHFYVHTWLSILSTKKQEPAGIPLVLSYSQERKFFLWSPTSSVCPRRNLLSPLRLRMLFSLGLLSPFSPEGRSHISC